MANDHKHKCMLKCVTSVDYGNKSVELISNYADEH